MHGIARSFTTSERSIIDRAETGNGTGEKFLKRPMFTAREEEDAVVVTQISSMMTTAEAKPDQSSESPTAIVIETRMSEW